MIEWQCPQCLSDQEPEAAGLMADGQRDDRVHCNECGHIGFADTFARDTNMGNTKRKTYEQAAAEALAFKARFPTTLYERWEIAGSLRRKKPDIGDIEHVIIPRHALITSNAGLFGEMVDANLLFEWIAQQQKLAPDSWQKHNYNYEGRNSGRPEYRWGQKYRGLDQDGTNHELFIADKENWGLILWLRTGPDDFNRRIIEYVNKQTRLQVKEAYLRYREGGQIIPCYEEKDFFAHLAMEYPEPETRIA